MGIFSKSKRNSERHSETLDSPPSEIHHVHYAPPRSERPSTSHGYINGPGPSQGWSVTPPPPYPTTPYQPCQQIFISNYIIPAPQPQSHGKKAKNKPQSASMVHLPESASMIHLPKLGYDMPPYITGAQFFNDGVPHWCQQSSQYLNQSTALYDLISSKFNSVVTSIDGERFSGDERELWVQQPPTQHSQQSLVVAAKKDMVKDKPKNSSRGDTAGPNTPKIANANYFAKVSLYANSRLPTNLPSMKLYIPTFPLLCVAAQYSEQVYAKPQAQEREAFIDADWRMGTKSMVIKSVPMDDMNVIVFAIRGSSTFLDWAVNLNSTPASPAGFLDDPGNFCHAGFLSVARKMVIPVAARLRNLLAEDPRRSACSLLITGHSAGGAVAALLYSHMLASSPETESELNILTGYFKRIHCVTFGAPPVSLLPLQKPERKELKKNLFFSFINEGDPVARAEKAYVKSLLQLYAADAPHSFNTDDAHKRHPLLTGNKSASTTSLSVNKIQPPGPTHAKSSPTAHASAPAWPVPSSTLSNAGRLIVLRSVPANGNRKKGALLDADSRMDDGVRAQIVTDEELRGVIWGDPVCHMMKLYTRRIEVLATNAVVGRR